MKRRGNAGCDPGQARCHRSPADQPVGQAAYKSSIPARISAAIGELAHADGVGQLDPFEGVDIHTEIPAMHRRRIQPGEQREVADDHQPLNVVGVGVFERLAMACARQRIVVSPVQNHDGSGRW